jgi:hypothetical protein
MPAGIGCSMFYLSSETDKLNISLVSGLQKKIVVTGISCTKNQDQFEQCDAARCSGFSGDGVVVPGGISVYFVATCNDENGNPMKFEPGDDFSGKINIEYYFLDEGSGAKRRDSGNIYAKAA